MLPCFPSSLLRYNLTINGLLITALLGTFISNIASQQRNFRVCDIMQIINWLCQCPSMPVKWNEKLQVTDIFRPNIEKQSAIFIFIIYI